jgi:hypothetical protein
MPKAPRRPRSRKGTGKSSKQPDTAPPVERAAPHAIAVGTVAPLSSLIAELLGALRPPSRAETKPLPAGTVGTEIPIALQALQSLITAAASQDNPGHLLWVRDTNELLVFTSRVTVRLDDGLVLITVPVSCDQAAEAMIEVPFAVGSKDLPAGLVFATEERPRGPEVIVDAWSEALIAFAWRLMLTVAIRIAAQSGVDEDGAGLVPIALTAARESLSLTPMARHTFDRVRQ